MCVEKLLADKSLHVERCLTEQILCHRSGDKVPVRSQVTGSEGELGDLTDTGLSEPPGSEVVGGDCGQSADKIAKKGSAHVGDNEPRPERVDVPCWHCLLEIATISVGGVVLSGSGAEQR